MHGSRTRRELGVGGVLFVVVVAFVREADLVVVRGGGGGGDGGGAAACEAN